MSRLVTFAALLGLAAGAVAQGPPAKPKPLAGPIVGSLAFSPDGSKLAVGVLTADRNGLVIVWDVAGRKRVAKSEPLGTRLVNVAFAPDGKRITCAQGATAVIFLDPATGAKVGEAGPFAAEVTAIVPVGKGQWVTAASDGTFRVWDETAKKVVREVATGELPYGWAVSPGGEWLFTGGRAGDRLWDLKTGAAVEAFPNRKGVWSQGTFMAADRLLIGTNLGVNRVVEVPSGKELIRFKSEGGSFGLAYAPATGVMASHYSGAAGAATPLAARPPTDAEKSRVAELLKECDSDDYPTREKAAAALLEVGPAIEPLLRQAMADGPSAEVRMRARVAREGLLNKPKFRLAGHTEMIRAGTFSQDGKLYATGGQDGLVILWDPATGKEVARWNAAE